jgi:protein-L-isoaspartate O-methyltransferase
MLSYPTDLSPAETEMARGRLRALAEQFATTGVLRSPEWQEVFERTWRHPYVPSYYPGLGQLCVTALDAGRRGEWLDTVYSDRTLVTKVEWVPMTPALRPGAYPVFASSATLPSLLLSMLELLDVTDGADVLQVGTGSGYTTALLCERLGSRQVSSLDIDPELVELACERLAANNYTPELAAADGADGYPPGAPYDRIIATCAVPAIPPAWLTQARPGAVILVDVHGSVGGTLTRLTVDAAGVATGRFLPHWAGFMAMRHTREITPPPQPAWQDDQPEDSLSQVDPAILHDAGSSFGFVAQWHLPDVTCGPADGSGHSIHLWALDGSHALARPATNGDGFLISQTGPRRLWDQVEDAHTFWRRAGRPGYDKFGITATTTEQHVWYDHPDSEHRWPLPLV